MATAVSHFQRRHGLEVTGKVGKETLAELNVPVEDRIRQIQSNMERWRWMPASLGDRYILVNIPEFRLDLIEAGKPALTMRVVVGKTTSRTPAFSDRMTYLELNPNWNIPASIAKEEILPKLGADPGYLARHDMEMVDEPGAPNRLRQRPGPANPLGQIKFMFPNEFDIYLHDSPADHLFSQAERDFSHGCIRLEKPVELAAYLLKENPEVDARDDPGGHPVRREPDDPAPPAYRRPPPLLDRLGGPGRHRRAPQGPLRPRRPAAESPDGRAAGLAGSAGFAGGAAGEATSPQLRS